MAIGFESILERMYSFYDAVQSAPIVKEILMKEFGPDIELIVMDYIEAMNEADLKVHVKMSSTTPIPAAS